jgi:CRISPR-associated protein Cas1
MIGTHSADFIMGTGKYPVKDAGYMACIRFGNSKKTLTRGAGLYMIEEFRPYIADRLALTLINKGQVTGKGFVQQKSGAVVMTEAARKEVLLAWQQRKAEEVQHPFLQEKMRVGLLWHAQARLLARHLRGDLDGYPPVVIR